MWLQHTVTRYLQTVENILISSKVKRTDRFTEPTDSPSAKTVYGLIRSWSKSVPWEEQTLADTDCQSSSEHSLGSETAAPSLLYWDLTDWPKWAGTGKSFSKNLDWSVAPSPCVSRDPSSLTAMSYTVAWDTMELSSLEWHTAFNW